MIGEAAEEYCSKAVILLGEKKPGSLHTGVRVKCTNLQPWFIFMFLTVVQFLVGVLYRCRKGLAPYDAVCEEQHNFL